MEKREYKSAEQALAVAKEAMWLAWQAAGGAQGMGVFRNNPGAGKDDVWKNAYNQEDYSMRHGDASSVNADYVFGRMLKLYFRMNGATLEFRDDKPRGDYQSWCYVYKTYAELFDAAEKVIAPVADAKAAA